MLEKQEQIIKQIEKADNILITGYIPWNEEVVLSALALNLILKKMGKKSEIILEKEEKKEYLKPSLNSFSVFPGYKEIKTSLDNLSDFVISLNLSRAQIGKVKYKLAQNSLNFYITPEKGFFSPEDVSARHTNFKHDLIITLGTPDLELLGEIHQNTGNFFYQTPVINIDNQASNEEYGEINIVELTRPTIAEIVFSIFEKEKEKYLNADSAHCLLGGIIYKTRNFKTPVTPDTLSATYNLISLGADKEKIINQFYRSHNLNTFKLWGKALNNLSCHKNEERLIWTTLNEKDFQETQTREHDLINLINELVVNIPKIEMLSVFYEHEEKTKGAIYSRRDLELKNLLQKYSPEGNNNFIQIKTGQKIEEIKEEIIEIIKERLSKIPS